MRLDVKGACTFLTCPFVGDHSHPVCSECGAVNYGNLFCLTCRTLRPAYNARIAQGWEDVAKRSGLFPELSGPEAR